MEKYFAASNSSEGFCSYYDDVFNIKKFEKIYAIKGGSGTGKAFFMKAIAKVAEKKGFSVRYIYCSSDASSLDGIIIEEPKIAVLDGTAPHVYEPKLLGVVDEIVDLGAFLNADILARSKNEIEHILKNKKRGFETAYRYLKAYRLLSQNIEELVYPCLKLEKMQKYASGFVKNIRSGSGDVEHRLVRAIGMRGLSSFDAYYENAKIFYGITDCFESAHVLLDLIYSVLLGKHADMYISNNPIISQRLDALCVADGGLCFEITDTERDGARRINMKRFVDLDAVSKIRHEYRTIAHIRDNVLDTALYEFEKIKNYHFKIEDIYGAAMNFDAKEQFTSEFCNKIL